MFLWPYTHTHGHPRRARYSLLSTPLCAWLERAPYIEHGSRGLTCVTVTNEWRKHLRRNMLQPFVDANYVFITHTHLHHVVGGFLKQYVKDRWSSYMLKCNLHDPHWLAHQYKSALIVDNQSPTWSVLRGAQTTWSWSHAVGGRRIGGVLYPVQRADCTGLANMACDSWCSNASNMSKVASGHRCST